MLEYIPNIIKEMLDLRVRHACLETPLRVNFLWTSSIAINF